FPPHGSARPNDSATAGYSITPSFPLWLPMYQNRPSASTIALRIPAPFDGSSNTLNFSVFGSNSATVSVSISFAQTRPAPSTATAYGPPRGPAGIGYSLTTFIAAGSTLARMPFP